MMKVKEQRKIKLVHRGIQYAIVRRLVLQWILFVTVAAFLSFIVQFMLNPLQSHAEAAGQFRVLVASQIVASMCLVPLFVFDSLAMSNKFVGPIVRLKSYLQSVDSNNPQELKFREGDHWQDVSAEVNAMFERLRENSTNKSEGDEPVTLASAKTVVDQPALALAKTDL